MSKRCYIYSKQGKKIQPIIDEQVNKKAQQKLTQIFKTKKELCIPKKYISKWNKVALYHPSGDVNKAFALVINPKDGAYGLNNKLNNLTGKEWIKFTCSWFIFNALVNNFSNIINKSWCNYLICKHI